MNRIVARRVTIVDTIVAENSGLQHTTSAEVPADSGLSNTVSEYARESPHVEPQRYLTIYRNDFSSE